MRRRVIAVDRRCGKLGNPDAFYIHKRAAAPESGLALPPPEAAGSAH
jgi:hypothetical protein